MLEKLRSAILSDSDKISAGLESARTTKNGLK